MPNSSSTQTDVHYAISVLLATGAVVVSGHVTRKELVWHAEDPVRPWVARYTVQRQQVPAWTITTKDGQIIEGITEQAMIELAHTEATRRRDDWQRTIDNVEQLQMFVQEDTPRYEVTA